MSPVLFLDVDGVLNHRGVFLPGKGPDPLCPMAVQKLRDLVTATGAVVVLSSTWRLGSQPSRQVEKLRAHGVLDHAHEDWRTKDLPHEYASAHIIMASHRGREIGEWLSRHPEVDRFAIVDDDSDMLDEQRPYFVQTTFERGLQQEHVGRLAAILGSDIKQTPEN